MGWLKEWFLKSDTDKDKSFRLLILEHAVTQDRLEELWNKTSSADRADPDFLNTYNNRTDELSSGGGLGNFGGVASGFYNGFDDLSDTMISAIESSLDDLITFDSPGITDLFKDKLEEVLEKLFDKIDPNESKLTSAIKADLIGGIAPILGLGITFEVATTLAELIHPLKEMGFGHISHFVHDTVGFKSLSQAYIDPVRDNMIGIPIRYQINSLTRPLHPPMKEGIDWYGRGHIGDAQLKEFTKWHGWEDLWDKTLKRSSCRPISWFMLNSIGESGAYDKDGFKFWLSDSGFGAFAITSSDLTQYEQDYNLPAPNMSQVDWIIKAYEKLKVKWEYSDIKSLTDGLYREGIFPLSWAGADGTTKTYGTQDASYKGFLIDKAIVSEDYADLKLSLIKSRMAVDTKEASRATYDALYRANQISSDDYTSALTALGYSSDAIGRFINLNDIKKQGETEQLSRAQLEGMFRRGVIDETLFRAKLLNLNYVSGDIDLIVADNKARL